MGGILSILAGREKKIAIMKAIGQQYGIHSPAAGVVLSLPVDGVAGLEPPPGRPRRDCGLSDYFV